MIPRFQLNRRTTTWAIVLCCVPVSVHYLAAFVAAPILLIYAPVYVGFAAMTAAASSAFIIPVIGYNARHCPNAAMILALSAQLGYVALEFLRLVDPMGMLFDAQFGIVGAVVLLGWALISRFLRPTRRPSSLGGLPHPGLAPRAL